MQSLNSEFRIEKDTLGEVKVPASHYWGAQTQRSSQNFPIGIGHETMPREIIEAFAYLKRGCAQANNKLNPSSMDSDKCNLIVDACDKILDGTLKDEFPLVVFQTGSGTQTNMNVNEVIAGYVNITNNAKLLHPNDDVNQGQSSNDTFPSAMHIASVLIIKNRLIPSALSLVDTLKDLEAKYANSVKSGRTHLQDAVPITFGQEVSGWRASIEQDISMLEASLDKLSELAIGGTAVGTGLNAPVGFDKCVCDFISDTTNTHFKAAPNKFHALTSLDEMVATHACIKALASDMMKMANDIRWLASGPRCGLGEITIPANEPGSSIMPGKVNPTQCEQVTMVATQIIGNDAAISMAATQGNFELNVFLPVTAYNFLQSARLLSESIESFNTRCVKGIKVNEDKMHDYLYNSLMLCTILSPYIGYESAARIAKFAHKNNCDLRQANYELGYMTPDKFDEVFKPEQMV